jgi:deoxyribonuclease V
MNTRKKTSTIHHKWDVKPQEAIGIQERLRDEVILKDNFHQISTIAGVDVGYESSSKLSRAVIAIYQFPELELLETIIAQKQTSFPYIPGLLSFREIPVILDAIESLTNIPDLILCDGHGFAHPRRFGLACHLGVITDIPVIGVAKSVLIGKFDELDEERGSWKPLIDNGEIVGIVLRSRVKVKPIYVSIGHRISLDSAREIVLQCCKKFKLPEPIRKAHQIASY